MEVLLLLVIIFFVFNYHGPEYPKHKNKTETKDD